MQIIGYNSYYINRFPCGLKFAFKKNTSPVAYCALSIKSGTRNEPIEYNGLAHFTEHMLFKGTQKRNSISINNRLEKLGGELNAYTTKEETVVYSTILKEDISKSIDLLFELVFTSTFSPKELKKERSVVLDEINMYKDTPSEYIFDDFEEFLFGNNPLSKSILGRSKTLKKISSEVITKYVKDFFIPENMSFTIVADLSQDKVEKLVMNSLRKYILPLEGYSFPLEPKAISPLPDSLSKGMVFTKESVKKHHQTNCIIGASAYSLYEKKRIPLILLTNILGGPSSNSLLNQVLRERSALVYNAEASYTQYSDTGSVMLYFGCDKSNLKKCLDLVTKELNKVRNKKLSENFLNAAKKQLLGQIAIASDNGEVQCLSMGKSLLSYNEIVPEEIVRKKIENVTSTDIYEVANEIFAEERLSKLIYK
ncbi:MAG: insulinase family protein [Bacteroidales bacterium]|nr:insulinase family protein [Bacteroidales bacterium]